MIHGPNFAKYWPIVKKVIIKYPISPQMCRYVTWWNVCAQKSPCSRANWSELPCKTQPFKTIAEKYSSRDVSTILFTGEKDIYSAHTKNPKESPNVRNYSNQEERRRDKTLAHTVNVQTVTDDTSRQVTTGRANTCLMLVEHGVKIIDGYSRNYSCRHTFDLKQVV